MLASLTRALRPAAASLGADGVSPAWIATFRARADRIIAAGRLLLATGSLFAIWLDPTQPRRYQPLAYGLLAAYTLYALVTFVGVWRSDSPHVRGTLRRHAGDLAVFAAIMYLTDGPTSPFFVLLAFALLAGTLHWRWRGALLTALACVLILVGLGVLDVLDATDPGLGFKTVVTRLVYLAVAATLLAWLGAHHEQVRTELWRLAERAPAAPDGTGWPVRSALAYAADALRVRRALLVWTDAEEPWTFAALRDGDAVREERFPPGCFAPWVAEPARHAGIVTNQAAGGWALLHLGRGRFEDRAPEDGPVVNPELVARFAMRSVVTVPVQAAGFEGRLFLLDIPNASFDDFPAAEIVAGRLRALFEQEDLLRRLRDSAALEERVRIARDLHDGVLQSLAGAALQLSSVTPLVASAPREAAARLASLQDTLALEQRELRSFIRTLGPGAGEAGPGEVALAPHLGFVAERLRRQWGIALRCELKPPGARLSAGLVYDLGRIVAEATANAVRHGGAKAVTAAIALADGAVVIEIADDGSGFPFAGRLREPELAARGWSPRSLRDRAAERGGRLAVESGPSGARVTVELPLAQEGRA